MDKGLQHEKIVTGLTELYKAKNADYGDSVHDTYMKYGLTSFLVRMEDKISRLRSLSKKSAEEQRVKDESIRDTLLDLANYAIIAVIEMDAEKAERTNAGCENDTPVVELQSGDPILERFRG